MIPVQTHAQNEIVLQQIHHDFEAHFNTHSGDAILH